MTWASKKTLWKDSMEMSRLAEIDPVTCGDSDKGLLVTSKLPLYWEFIGMSFLQRRPIWRTRTGTIAVFVLACGHGPSHTRFSCFASCLPFNVHLLIETQVRTCVLMWRH